MDAQSFPFYKNKNYCNHEKTWCLDQQLFKHHVMFKSDLDNDFIKFPAFQIIVDANISHIDNLLMYSTDGQSAVEIRATDIQLDFVIQGNQTIITHWGQLFTRTIPAGITATPPYLDRIWQAEMQIHGEIYYSELFAPIQVQDGDILPCGDWLLLDAVSQKNIGNLIYEGTGSFKQNYLLPTDIGRPTYEYKEEGEEDGKGEFYQTMRRVEKTFAFEFFAPEYMTDAMALLPLHEFFVIFTQYGTYNANDLKFEVKEWETECIARCEISFQTDFAAARGTV